MEPSGEARELSRLPRGRCPFGEDDTFWLGPQGRALLLRTPEGFRALADTAPTTSGVAHALPQGFSDLHCAFAPQETHVAVAATGRGSRALVYDLSRPGAPPRRLPLPDSGLKTVQWTPRGDALLVTHLTDGRPADLPPTVAAPSSGSCTTLWRFPRDGEPGRALRCEPVLGVRSRGCCSAVLPHARSGGVALAWSDDRLELIDGEGRPLTTRPRPAPVWGWPRDLEWSPDLRRVAVQSRVAGGARLDVYDLTDAAGDAAWKKLSDPHSLWWSPRGSLLGWCTQDELWVAAPGEEPRLALDVSGRMARLRGFAWAADEAALYAAVGTELWRVPAPASAAEEPGAHEVLFRAPAGEQLENPRVDARGAVVVAVIRPFKRGER